MSMIGKSLIHYEITSQLGKGGMGEVYLADDTTLDRKVALKFLPEEFTNDPERMARFEREAKLLATLNHSNIAGIYGLEQANGIRFLVLEYVEGETLQSRLSKGALTIEDALEISRQIAEGLEAAHEKGVIHRDLKPSNVMITGDEKVKILDFGLAKAFFEDQGEMKPQDSPTLSAAATMQGVILGTAAYMSPEQAKGKSVDKRADIWAFGCILYECLTGRRAFEGETVTETLAAVIKEEPAWDILPKSIPQNIYLVLKRCLEKEKKRRFRDVADAMILLDDIPKAVSDITPDLPLIKIPQVALIIAVLSLIGIAVLGVLYHLRGQTNESMMYLEVSTQPTQEPTSLALSPDGRFLVYVASTDGKQRLWLRPFDKPDAQPLVGTEGATFPFWSPDSKSVGFFAGAKLKRIEISGGMPIPLAEAPAGLGGSWNQNDIILFTPNIGNPLYRVPATGGEAVPVTHVNPPEQTSHIFPKFLPDGQHFLYKTWGNKVGFFLASFDSSETKFLCNADSNVVYAPPGYLLFIRRNTLFAQPFDSERGDVSGNPVQIADSVEVHPTYNPGGFSVSDTGILAYRTTGTLATRQLVWFDAKGNKLESIGEPASDLYDPDLSLDGSQVAVAQSINQSNITWLIDVERGVFKKFTNVTESQLFPIWAPDTKSIVFSAQREGTWDLHQIASSGIGNAEILLKSMPPGAGRFAEDWSQDGKYILYLETNPNTGRDLWLLPMTGDDREPRLFMNTDFEEQNGQFSPDAEWIAYQSNESGRFEVYVQPRRGPGEKKQISTSGGIQPRWHPDGNKIFYIAPDGNLIAVPVQAAGQSMHVGLPETMFQTKIPLGGYMDIMRIQYDVFPDGSKFLMNITTDDQTPSPITIVTHWTGLIIK